MQIISFQIDDVICAEIPNSEEDPLLDQLSGPAEKFIYF